MAFMGGSNSTKLSDEDRQTIQAWGWNLSEEEMLLVANNLSEMRLSSTADWSAGRCVMVKVNRFDSFGKAGIRVGDVIAAINGEALVDEPSFALALCRLGVGAKPVLKISRGAESLDVTMELLKKNLNFAIDEIQVQFERKISP